MSNASKSVGKSVGNTVATSERKGPQGIVALPKSVAQHPGEYPFDAAGIVADKNATADARKDALRRLNEWQVKSERYDAQAEERAAAYRKALDDTNTRLTTYQSNVAIAENALRLAGENGMSMRTLTVTVLCNGNDDEWKSYSDFKSSDAAKKSASLAAGMTETRWTDINTFVESVRTALDCGHFLRDGSKETYYARK